MATISLPTFFETGFEDELAEIAEEGIKVGFGATGPDPNILVLLAKVLLGAGSVYIVCGLIDETSFWVISIGVNDVAYAGFIWTVNWKLGINGAPLKLKVIKNQYWELEIY